MKRVLPLVFLVACAPEHLAPFAALPSAERVLPESDTALVFDADFTEVATGPLVAGTAVRIDFAPDRLTKCRGSTYGYPAWGISAFYRINGGEVSVVPIVQPNLDVAPWIDLPQAGTLELWFANNDAFGCIDWDSDYGQNYRFDVLSETIIPGWMGNASAVISRQTCSGGFCEGDLRPLDQGFRYDTWARQRATVAKTTFQVWAPGVTDDDRSLLWERLDARIHWAYGPDLVEAGWDWVNVYDFPGNDVRYAYDLRTLDPLGGNTIVAPEDCPDLPLRHSADGYYVEADLWVWFSVNGQVLAPIDGGWVGTFQDYAGLYAPCL